MLKLKVLELHSVPQFKHFPLGTLKNSTNKNAPVVAFVILAVSVELPAISLPVIERKKSSHKVIIPCFWVDSNVSLTYRTVSSMLRMTDWLADERLQAKVSICIVGGNAGHMRELTRLRYLGLLHRRRWLWTLLLLTLAPGNTQRYIFRVAD